MSSPSPSPSPSGTRSSASRPSARKTYSRRRTTHAEKRKAQAQAESKDSDDDDDDDDDDKEEEEEGGESDRKYSTSRSRPSDIGSSSPVRAVKKMKRDETDDDIVRDSRRQGRIQTRIRTNQERFPQSGVNTISRVDSRSSSFSGSSLTSLARLSSNGSSINSNEPIDISRGHHSDNGPRIHVEPASSSTGLGKSYSNGSGSISQSTTYDDDHSPSTPPRSGSGASRPLRARTPGSGGSPRDLSAIFAAVSPARSGSIGSIAKDGASQLSGSSSSAVAGIGEGSRSSSGEENKGGRLGVGLNQVRRPRKMLSKAQSMSAIETGGSPLKKNALGDDGDGLGEGIESRRSELGNWNASPNQSPLQGQEQRQAPTTPSKLKALRQVALMPVPTTPSSGARSGSEGVITPRKGGALIEPIGGGNSGGGGLGVVGGPGSPSTGSGGGGSGGAGGGRLKRTYGSSRSFLISNNQEIEEKRQRGTEGSMEDEERQEGGVNDKDEDLGLGGVVRESYADLRKKYEVDAGWGTGGGSGNLVEDLLSARAPEPVSDMRSRGENRRFMDELTYLIDGIATSTSNSSQSLKRASAMDVLKNMGDEEGWIRKMEVCGMTDKVWEGLMSARNGEDDEIGNAICLIFLATLVSANQGLSSILTSPTCAKDCVKLVATQLQVRTGPLDLAFKGKVTSTVSKLRVLAGKAWSSGRNESKTPSTMLITSRILKTICQSTTNITFLPTSNALVSEKVAVKLTGCLDNVIKPVVDHLDLYEKGLDLIPKDSDINLELIENSVQALNDVVKQSSEHAILLGGKVRYAEVLGNLVVVATAMALDEDGDQRGGAQCLILALQVLITVSGSTPAWAEATTNVPGIITCLIRIILYRQTISSLLSARRKNRLNAERVGEEGKKEEKESRIYHAVMNVDDGESEESEDEQDEDEVQATLTMRYTKDDVLCVVIALLASLLFVNKSKVNNMIWSIKVAKCNKPTCLRSCRCRGAKTVPEVLVSLYIEYQALRDEPNGLFVCGYLALILSILITHSQISTALLVISKLPGESTRERLEELWNAIKELQGVVSISHRRLKKLMMSGNGSVDHTDDGNGDLFDGGTVNGDGDGDGGGEDNEEEGVDQVLQTSMDELREYINNCEMK